jgi:predicted RNase H-like HicB family nuclease
MKQKYLISKDSTSGSLIIKEYAELDKELFSLIFEESYDGKTIEDAVKDGKEALVSVLRTPNLYPIAEYADKIAENVILLIKGKVPDTEPLELVFNDIDLMQEKIPAEPEKKESVELDKLLDDDDSKKKK